MRHWVPKGDSNIQRSIQNQKHQTLASSTKNQSWSLGKWLLLLEPHFPQKRPSLPASWVIWKIKWDSREASRVAERAQNWKWDFPGSDPFSTCNCCATLDKLISSHLWTLVSSSAKRIHNSAYFHKVLRRTFKALWSAWFLRILDS